MGLLLNLGFYWRWRRFISLDSKRLVFPGFSLWVLCWVQNWIWVVKDGMGYVLSSALPLQALLHSLEFMVRTLFSLITALQSFLHVISTLAQLCSCWNSSSLAKLWIFPALRWSPCSCFSFFFGWQAVKSGTIIYFSRWNDPSWVGSVVCPSSTEGLPLKHPWLFE